MQWNCRPAVEHCNETVDGLQSFVTQPYNETVDGSYSVVERDGSCNEIVNGSYTVVIVMNGIANGFYTVAIGL